MSNAENVWHKILAVAKELMTLQQFKDFVQKA